MTALWAIIGLTFRALLRSRVLVVTALFLLGLTLALPHVLRDDGTRVGRARVWIHYQLQATLLTLSIATVGVGPGLVAGERERRQLQQVLVKPVPFAVLWLGKWMALGLVGGFLLLGSTVVFLVGMYRTFGFNRMTREAELNHRVWTVRRVARPVAGPRWIEGEGTGGFRFELPAIPEGSPVLLRTRFFSAAVISRWTVTGEWDVRTPAGSLLTGGQRELRPGAVQEIALPAFAGTIPAGRWEVYYTNRDRDTVLFDEQEGVTLWSEAGGLEANLFRAILLGWFRLLLLAAAGLTVGVFFSTPVAIFMATFLLLLFLFSGHIGWVVQTGQIVEPPHTHGDEPCTEHHQTLLGEAAERLLRGLYRVLHGGVGVIREFDPIERTAESCRIEERELNQGVFHLVVVRCGVLVLLSVLAATCREWG